MIDKKITIPIKGLNFTEAFDQLTHDEKLYTYFLQRACWDGAPIVLFQISYESPALFIIFQSFFSSFSPFDELKKIIFLKSNGSITDVDYKQFIRYAAKFYSNMGNYSSFGHMKFIPELTVESFEEILKLSSNYNSDIQYIWECTKDIIYDDSLNHKTINLTERNGRNYYYLNDISEENIKTIDNILNSKGIELLNTRLLMINNKQFACLVASVDEKVEEWDTNLIGYHGEFRSFLNRVNENLTKAKEFSSNENQRLMLESYVESFRTGDIKKHMDAQRFWVKDKKPPVEMNIGWIETYIDPMGVRATFEGWVALADKDKSKKFNSLVENAEGLLTQLPWSMDFERPSFVVPEFTALDVVCFACNNCPIGINIPNYQEIKENDGFKNISLSNAYPSYTAESLTFCSEKDVELLKVLGKQAYTMHVACHELLGHGSGKILKKNENGNFNFDWDTLINPLTQEHVNNYEHNETFESKFTSIGRSFEECRADIAGLYFCFFKEIHDIFECDDGVYKDVIYSIWLLYIRKGILGLSAYNEDVKRWGQAHTQGAWVFVQYLLENQNAGQEILQIKLEEDKKTFHIILNKEMLICYGKALVTKIFTMLHIWRSTGDIEAAKEFYDNHSTVNQHFLKIRKIVIDYEIPRRLVLNQNLQIDESMNVTIETYPESLEGIIKSFVDRYGTKLNKEIYTQWTKYDTNFLKI